MLNPVSVMSQFWGHAD